ncbi:MAG: hypothetical protein WAU07_00970 [Microgenomates group bacterium]
MTFFLSFTPVSAQITEIGTIDVPPGVEQYNASSGADIGLVFFISRMIRLATLVAGLWVTANTMLAGYAYLSSQGKADAHTRVRDILTMSTIGLVLIVTAYTVAGLLSLLIFGDPLFILNPTIEGPV